MARTSRDSEYDEFEPPLGFGRDAAFTAWENQLATLAAAPAVVREATSTGQDGRRVKDLQVACESISVKSVRENVTAIKERLIFLAEIDAVHVGFCIAAAGPRPTDPLFIQVVGVAPPAQRRGIGVALLSAAAEREPRRDLALATQDDNVAARTMNERFALSTSSIIERVPLTTYRERDLGIKRGDGYRAWRIRRQV